MEGSSTSRLSVEVAGYRDGQKYRCVVKDAEGNTAVSGTAVITVAEPEGTGDHRTAGGLYRQCG